MLELVPPGRVIFLRPLKTNNVRTSWDAVWVKAEEVIREASSCLLSSTSVVARVCAVCSVVSLIRR